MDFSNREQDKLKVKNILRSKTSSGEQISLAFKDYFSKYSYHTPIYDKKIGESLIEDAIGEVPVDLLKILNSEPNVV